MKIGIINGKGLVTAVSCMYIERYAFEILFLQISGTIRLMNLIDFLFNVKSRLVFLDVVLSTTYIYFYGLFSHFRLYKTRMATLTHVYN